MQITYIKQGPPGLPPDTLDYDVTGDQLTVTYRARKRDGTIATEVSDTFDFTGLPDGRADVSAIATSLPIQPIRSAERIDGLLHVTLLDWTREA